MFVVESVYGERGELSIFVLFDWHINSLKCIGR